MRAFLCGINKYPDSPLNGCVNDITITRQILRDKYNLTGSNMRVLLDERATTKAMIDRLKWLVSETFVHDRILFWFSGHGAYITNRDPAKDYEVTGNDQIICPVDLDWGSKLISDDMFYGIVSNKNPKCKLVAVIDACHSGTFYRAPLAIDRSVRPRFIDPPLDIKMRDDAYSPGSPYRPVVKPSKPDIQNFIMISGCKDTQTSADAFIDGGYHGALSYYLQKHWRNGNTSVLNLHKAICTDLKKNGFDQEPVLSVGPNTDVSKLI